MTNDSLKFKEKKEFQKTCSADLLDIYNTVGNISSMRKK